MHWKLKVKCWIISRYQYRVLIWLHQLEFNFFGRFTGSLIWNGDPYFKSIRRFRNELAWGGQRLPECLKGNLNEIQILVLLSLTSQTLEVSSSGLADTVTFDSTPLFYYWQNENFYLIKLQVKKMCGAPMWSDDDEQPLPIDRIYDTKKLLVDAKTGDIKVTPHVSTRSMSRKLEGM